MDQKNIVVIIESKWLMRLKKLLSIILLNSLWIIPVGLMLFARLLPDEFDRFWARLFGQ